ncbi:MAG: cobalamin biosynthesis protein CobG [Pseudomonadota bacterium]
MTQPSRRKGWCPSAHRPMLSGDGLVVRIRPVRARLTAVQALGLADAAGRFGNGILEITRRGNLQLRGVAEAAHAPLLAALDALALVPPDAAAEGRLNLLCAPLWAPGDDTDRIATALEALPYRAPALPAKFGVAVDAGEARALADIPADIRIERAAEGGLILRADGATAGRPVTAADAPQAALDLARWFLASGGAAAGRMRRHLAAGARLPAGHGAEPAACAAPLRPGPTSVGPAGAARGLALGLPFGQTTAPALSRVIAATGARALRITPWRLLVLEGAAAAPLPADFLGPAEARLLAVDACPGAPACSSASVATRALARSLAPRIAGSLHVSGCAKGCARSAPADWTLIGRSGYFDIVRDGDVAAAPVATGLSAAEALAFFEGR